MASHHDIGQAASRGYFAIITAIVAIAFSLAIAPCAFAQDISFSGSPSTDKTAAQFYAYGTGSVFVDVRQSNGAYIAKGLQSTVGQDSSILSLTGLVPGRVYEVSFLDAPQGNATHVGSITPVYAKCGDTLEIIGERTAVDGAWGSFVAPASRIVDGKRYLLQSEKGEADEDGILTFSYELDESVVDLSEVAGTLTYIDQQGKIVRVDRMPAFLESDGFEVASLVFASPNGSSTTAYEVLGIKKGEVASFTPESGQTDFVVFVRELAVNDGEGSYDVSIKYVTGSSDDVLFVDTFKVNKNYRYTVPDEFYQTGSDGMLKVYRLDDSFAGKNPIVLDLGNAPEGNVVNVPYNLVESDQSLTWTVQLLNGASGQSEPLVEPYTVSVKLGETVSYEAKPIEVGGTTFYPAGVPQGQSKVVSYTYGDANLLDTVYYVTASFAPQAYDVTVQYVNLADGSVIGAQKLHADPNSNEDLQIAGPEQLDVDGVQYVRLAGQDQPRRHNFYSSQRTYTVYYRDVNDDLLANATVIETIVNRINRVETTVVPGSGSASTAVTTLTGEASTATVVSRDDGATAEGGHSVMTGDGVDMNAQRAVIEDEVTPLASAPNGSSSNGLDGIRGNTALLVGIGVVALIAMMTAFFAAKKRRKASRNHDGGAQNV